MNADPIADFLTRIRNGLMASHQTVDIPLSKMKEKLCKILKAEGFISDYRVMSDEGHKFVRVHLRYHPDGEPMIQEIRRASRPGCRTYVGVKEIPTSPHNFVLNILSTSRGVITDRQAREANVGGEVLCTVM
jgi:small subunit ribosomal protein S8